MILRAIEPEDVDFILECESDPEAAKWSDYRAPFSHHQLLTYALTYDADPFSAGQIRLVAETDEKEKIGIVDLYDISEKDSRAYIGICIHPQKRRQDLGLQALQEALRFAQTRLGIGQLAAKVSIENKAGLNLFEKAGFQEIATLPSWHRFGRDLHDISLLLYKL